MAVCYMKCHSLVYLTASILRVPNIYIEKHEAALLFFFLSINIDFKYDTRILNMKFVAEKLLLLLFLFHENPFQF